MHIFQEADANLQFDEMILEAARAIMAASSALVRAANAAQRELIDQGKVSRSPLISSDDGQWSEGLISAARLVAAATHSLVEAAQNLVQGLGTEELLISSAKQVAASTAQLLIACKVRSDPNSETGRRLQAAGNAVIKSTDNLVRAAQQALDMEEEHILKINTSMVDGMAQEINARSEVIKMEKQLEEARNKLCAIRQAKYRHRGTTGLDDSDNEEYLPPPPLPPTNYHPYGYHPQQRTISPNSQQYTTINRSYNTTPLSPPSFQNTSTSTLYPNQSSSTLPPPVSPKINRSVLTANAVPRPYHSDSTPGVAQSPLLTRSFTTAPVSSINAQSPAHNQHSLRSNNYVPHYQTDSHLNAKNPHLEACIQDLHDKTFGKSGVVPLSTFKTTTQSSTGGPIYGSNQNGQNYEGYTSR